MSNILGNAESRWKIAVQKNADLFDRDDFLRKIDSAVLKASLEGDVTVNVSYTRVMNPEHIDELIAAVDAAGYSIGHVVSDNHVYGKVSTFNVSWDFSS